MNYIECFNRSRAANCLQPVFFVPGAPQCCQVWSIALVPLCAVPGASMLPGVECYPCTFCAVPGASMLPGVDVLQPVPLCAVPGVSMLPGVECYPCTFAPFLVCLDAARCGVLPVPLCAVPGASMLPGVECYPCTFCAVPGASMLPGVECCPLYLLRPSWCLPGAHFVTLYIL